MENNLKSVNIQLPNWLLNFKDSYQNTNNIEGQMQFVVNAAAENIKQQTGGPFAAAVFNCESGELISLGANLVTSASLSILHAEVVALTFAQQQFHHFRLNSPSIPNCRLVTSSEPCTMCVGAVCWAGVKELVCGAPRAAAEAIGFDEGPISPNWLEELSQRGIKVTTGMLKNEATQVLKTYQSSNGTIYNG